MTVLSNRKQPQPLTGTSVGEPTALSALARMLLALHRQPASRADGPRLDPCRGARGKR
jgi:hypothetical protein